MRENRRNNAGERSISAVEPLERRQLLSVSFAPPASTPVGSGASAVATADLNGDGIADLVTANRTASTVSVLLGDGAGGLGLRADYPVSQPPTALALADVNGDELPDIVTGSETGVATVQLNLGDGTFAAGADFEAGGAVRSLAVQNVTGDGGADIVATIGGTGGFSTLAGNGDGTFDAFDFTAVPGNAIGLALGDVDGNGSVDFVTVDADANTVTVTRRIAGVTEPAQQSYAVGRSPTAVTLADLNADGALDLIVSSSVDGEIAVLLNTVIGGAFAPKVDYRAAGVSNDLLTGDVDGDGFTDVVATATTADGLLVLQGNGAGSLVGLQGLSAGGEFTGVALADVNADGKPDLLATDAAGTSVNTFVNTSTPGLLPTADLVTAFRRVSLPALFVPGDRGSALISVSNASDVQATGRVTVNLYASADAVLDENDVLLNTGTALTDRAINLRGGRTTTLRASFVADDTIPAGPVYLLANVNTTDIPEGSVANNTVASDTTYELTQQFGRLGNRTLRQTRTDADGTEITFSLSGPGTGTVTTGANDALNVTLDGTTSRTTLIITPRGRSGDGVATVGGIVSQSTMRAINASRATITDGVTITSADTATPVTLTLGTLAGGSITSDQPIRSLSLAEWTDGNALSGSDEVLTAPYASTINARGAFAGAVTFSGAGSPAGQALRSATIRGDLAGVPWTIGGNVSTITVAGSVLPGWSGNIAGSLRSMNVRGDFSGDLATASSLTAFIVRGSVAGSTVLAGASLGADNSLGGGDDTYTAATIRVISITGSVTTSVFAAGINPVNDVLLDGDDALLAGGRISIVSVRGPVDASSRFVAETLPRRATLGGTSVLPADDVRFSLTPIV
ncbi:MAG TPA: VCBS repeat-containing protein [Tepidisphaeraceae bacterium]|jgi:hypothetical protein|nr:VCBS repeat-containing protein [Tepidisphaeraceae bacterium]